LNKIITFQDLREFDFRNLWELKNPKFAQAPEGSQEAMPQFKLRHSGSTLSFLYNYLIPSRLYGIRKLFAVLLWLFIMVLIFGTVYAYRTGSGEMGQVYFTGFFIVVYLLLFIERIFELIGERPIVAFVDDYQGQFKHQEKEAMQAKMTEAKEKARLKKEKEDREFKEALAEVGPLIGSGLKSLVKEGGVSSRAAQSARGTLKTDSLSSRAAKAARGTPRSTKESNNQSSSSPSSIKIEGYTGSYWETCATGLDNNANYIASRMKQIRKSNSRYTKLRAVDNQGRVIDVG